MSQSEFFSHLPRPVPGLQASVIIPARDEARNIICTLEALAAQHDLDGSPLNPARFEILLLCNNCSDQTALIARTWGQHNLPISLHVIEATFSPEQSNVGHARRLLMDAACARLNAAERCDGSPQAICSTDADTRVFPTFIAAILAEMSAGAEAVGGRILVSKSSGAPRAFYLRDTAYHLYAARLESLLDPQSADTWPRHFQFFGAAMAISPRAYQAVGGLPHVPCLEDMELKKALIHQDIPLRHSPHVRVITSARMDGRVALGLSTQLSQWTQLDAQHQCWLVPSAFELEAKFTAKRALRALHSRASSGKLFGETLPLAQQLQIEPQWLEASLKSTPYFGAFWANIEAAMLSNPTYQLKWPPIPVQTAIDQLRIIMERIEEK